jgi:hypothetical protein
MRARLKLFDAAHNRCILASRSSCAVLLQNRGGAMGGWFCCDSHDHDRATLFDMTCVKFLLADVIRL